MKMAFDAFHENEQKTVNLLMQTRITKIGHEIRNGGALDQIRKQEEKNNLFRI